MAPFCFMAIPTDDVLLLAKHLQSELIIAQQQMLAAQQAVAEANAAFSEAQTQYNALLNVKNSLLQIPVVAEVIKKLGVS